MKGKDEIKELFSDKLGNFEAKVSPDLWASVSSQVGATTAGATATGMSIISKVIIGVGIVAASITGVVLLTSSPEEKQDETITTSSVEDKDQSSEDLRIEPKVNNNVSNQGSTENTIVSNNEEVGELEDNTESNIVEDENALRDQPLIVYETNQLLEDEPLDEVIEEEVLVEEVVVEQEAAAEEEVETEEEVVTNQPVKLQLSNIITPNNDGNNDVLFVKSEGLKDFNLVVLDINNTVVFQSNDPNFKWGGVGMNGVPVKDGNYVYFITARDENGLPVNEHSSLTIVR